MSLRLTVRKPKAVLFDMFGTVVKSDVIQEVFFPFISANADQFLQSHWNNKVVVKDVERLCRQAADDGSAVQSGENEDAVRQAVVNYVINCNNNRKDNDAIRIFRFHVLFDALKHGSLTTSVYADVANAFNSWTTSGGIKLYLLSNGWKYAMKKFLEKSNHGNLASLITDCFDTEMGQLDNHETYKAILAKLSFPPEDVLFLTHWGVQGIVAHQSGLSVVVVSTHRADVARERTEEVRQNELPFVRTLDDLCFANDAPTASSMFDSTNIDASSFSNTTGPVSTAAGGSSKGSSSKSSGSSAAFGSSSRGSSSKYVSSAASGSSSRGSSSKSGSSAASGSSSRGSSSKSGSSAASGSSSRGSSSKSGSSAASGSSSRGSSSKSGSSAASGSSSRGSSSKSGSSTAVSGSSGSKTSTKSGSSSRGSSSKH